VSKNADDEDILLKKKSITVNESTKRETILTETTINNNIPKEWITPKGLSKDNIIGDINQGVSTRHKLSYCDHVAFVSQIEPMVVNDAFNDSN